MKKALCLVAILALVTTASADNRVFFTKATGAAGEWGLDLAENHMVPTVATIDINNNVTNGWDYYGEDWGGGPLTIDQIGGAFAGRTGTIPPANHSGIPTVDFSVGEWAYIWFQFNRDADGNYVQDLFGDKIVGLKVEITGPGDVDTTYYVNCDKERSGSWKWNGSATPPDYPEWHNNPQTMLGLTNDSLKNVPGDVPANLYAGKNDAGSNPVDQYRMGLIGAAEFSVAGTYEITITDFEYASGEDPGVLWSGKVIAIPEPASLLLLGLGVLLRRR
jgi:hypothetical protein